MPRYVFLLRADADSEAGKDPSKETFEQMHAYNSKIKASGNMLAGEGLGPSSYGVRLEYPTGSDSQDGTVPGDKIVMKQGPFPSEGENRVICGFWLIKADNIDHAVELAKGAPLQGGELEIRCVQELEDFGDLVPEKMKEEEGEWRKELEKKA